MTREDRQRWDERFATVDVWQSEHPPLAWLIDHVPVGSGQRALDLACGLGHNAIWLAEQGYRVVGVDASRVALSRAGEAARAHQVSERVLFVHADLDQFRPASLSVDLICVIRYLNRDLFPALAMALKPGGTLMCATLNWQQLERYPESNPAYLLQPGELRAAFPSLTISDYDERDGMSYLAARRA